jgi:putative transposase
MQIPTRAIEKTKQAVRHKNRNWFFNFTNARDVIEDWRKDYNEVKPHSSLKGATLKGYAEITVGL